jgi:2-haloacid dehalogenase
LRLHIVRRDDAGNDKSNRIRWLSDLRPAPDLCFGEEMFPGRGAELSNVWPTRQFEYTWLRTVAQRYRNFLGVIDGALVVAGHSLSIDIPDQKRKALVDGYLHMKA